MAFATRLRWRVVGVTALALVAGAGPAVAGGPVSAAPPPAVPGIGSGRASPPAVPGYPPVTAPPAAAPVPLPRLVGSVPLRRPPRLVPPRVPAPRILAAAPTDRVALRALVVAVDAADFGLPTWRTVLDRVGAGYDVLLTRDTPLTADRLIRADGTGRYNAILLTSSGLLHPDGAGGFVSGLDGVEWNLLWAYERDYAVRQVALYASYGSWPEDYCLRPVAEGGVGDTPLAARLTTAGAGVFDYLRSAAQIPIVQSYVYRTSVAAGCAATPILTTAANEVLGVTSTSTDGRERLVLTFTNNQYLLQSDLLTYGLLRWASRGLFLGEHRHFLNVDVDDWFNTSDHYLTSGQVNSDPGYQVTAREMVLLTAQLAALRVRYPLAAAFQPSLAYNGGGADLTAGSLCSLGGSEQLTATTRCLRGQYRWINHTLEHPELNATDDATTRAEIEGNLTVAAALGLAVDRGVLKTPEYSGLGVYHPDPDNDVDPPTDFGLAASNPALLRVARELGVRYLHGNMSFASHVPTCFNCAIIHPLEPAVSIVPDWPTNIAYHTTTPAEQTAFYNSFYGPNGRFPYWPRDLTYEEMMSYETDLALRHLSSGSAYTHTFHIANVHDYSLTRTLLTDWLNRLVGKYTTYYRVPLLSPAWPALGGYTQARTGHFAALAGGLDAVYDRAANTVTVSSASDATVTVTGARTAGFTGYGTDVSAPVAVTAGTAVVFTPVVRR